MVTNSSTDPVDAEHFSSILLDAAERLRGLADHLDPRASLTTASGEAAEARDGQMQLAMAEIERLEALNLALSSTDEMENYRLALAWIRGQSTDPQAKEIAATALDTYSVHHDAA